MSANTSTLPRTNTPFSPEQRAAFRTWRFGSTLDWCSEILREINYPITELRWFVDGVQGLCKGKEMRIAHSVLAKRAGRFKNKPQASDLARRAIEANNEWARDHRCMIFDIERPKPGEMEGKDKRARTKYTDYLTPAAVWAQEMARIVKAADKEKWSKDSKYRRAKIREILDEALKMLPQFERGADMPDNGSPSEAAPLSLSEYVLQRERIALAEIRRIRDRAVAGDPVSIEEIDERLAVLEISYEKIARENEKSFCSTRNVLIGLKETRLRRAMNFCKTEEVMAEFDEKNEKKGKAGLTLVDEEKSEKKGKTGDPLLDATSIPENTRDAAPLQSYLDAITTYKGKTGDPLSASAENADRVPDMRASAQAYVAAGRAVFPLHTVINGACSCVKAENCKSKGKHPRTLKGVTEATTDAAQVTAWWNKWPDANIGLATGKASGLVVLDVDPKNNGAQGLAELCDRIEIPETSTIETGGAGAHYYFADDGDDLRNSVGQLGEGLDVRANGGYVVAPPSLHASGCRYRIANAAPPAPLPEALRLEMLAKPAARSSTSSRRTPAIRAGMFPSTSSRTIPDGMRSNKLISIAGALWHKQNMTFEEMYAELLRVNAEHCLPPLEESEVWDIARSETRYPRNAYHVETAPGARERITI
jgi:hypothetical protein